ncbi:MAG: hypothetical protein UR94_C0030G0005 [Parcubacteria group bacterium GW2011_GWA2_36_10]|nr:MAG: hypothetical protein UR94_C0030G0005 [Parcubacteria group bacterium GW2011_GWA2_36_10]
MKKTPNFLYWNLFLLVFLMSAQMVRAESDFNYSNIISDQEANDYSSMNKTQIVNFLNSKNSYLKNYYYYGYSPAPGEVIATTEEEKLAKAAEKSAAEVIYNAAYEAKISPKFLLTMMQKEMSLVEDPDPTENQLAFAMGYYCYDGQSCNPNWRGFGKQVRATALQFRDYLDNISGRTYRPGQEYNIEGEVVVPENNVTAGLYNYTPHLHGNKLFKTIWDRFGFGTGDSAPIVGIIPEGSIVKASDGTDTDTIYLIHNNLKLPFASMTAIVSRYDPKMLMTVSSLELNKFAEGPSIDYPAYSILQGPDNKKYLLDGLNKRLITSDQVFKALGYNPDEIITASSTALANINDGEPISDVSLSPVGQLYKDKSTGGVYYVKDGQKYPIVDPEIIKINYPGQTIKTATAKQLESWNKQLPIKLKDGLLVKGTTNPQVYVITNGERKWLEDENTFLSLGYKWQNVITVSDRVIKLNAIAQSLKL